MPATLLHSPADIIRQMLIELGLANGHDSATWPSFVSSEPTSPENVITLYDTVDRGHGREMIGGERQQHFGFQVRVRAATHELGWQKAYEIAEAFDSAVYEDTVHIDDANYLVYCVTRTGGVNSLGTEPITKRRIFTINALVALERI